MIFSKDAKKALESTEELREDIDSIKSDIETFKKSTSVDLGGIRQELIELKRVMENMSLDKEETDADSEMKFEKYQEDIDRINKGIASLKESLADLILWTNTVKKEFTSVKAKIKDASTEIKNKISYSVSRLKT